MSHFTHLFFLTLILVIQQPWSCLAQGRYPTRGVRMGIDANSGQRPMRRNINDMHAEGGAAWDLYILGLKAFQEVPEIRDDSYYQIAGIHGMPSQAWNGVEGPPGRIARGGYCPHGEPLFAPWHTLYIATFEQALHDHVQRIAAEFPSSVRPNYLAAASTLRIPYWDWALDPTVPPATTWETITVNTPNGEQTMENPLFSYRFQNWPLDPNQFPTNAVAVNWRQTRRCAGQSGGSRPSEANQRLLRAGNQLRQEVYNTFTRTTSWDSMSSTHNQGSNFEQPHNRIHVLSGCDVRGNMASVAFSSFDPLFWLHHTNIDRLIALWQAIHPSSTPFTNTYQTQGLFSIPHGTTIDAMTPLHPFYTPDGDFWNATSARLISAFGYTYPELPDHAMSEDALRQSAIQAVNQLYGPRRVGLPTSTPTRPTPVVTAARSFNTSPETSTPIRLPFSASVMGTTPAGPAGTYSRVEPDLSGGYANAPSPTESEDAQDFSQAFYSDPFSLDSVEPFPSSKSLSGETREYFFIIGVLREHLPLPCSIDIYLGNNLAGSVTYLEMPARGESYAEVPVDDAVQNTLDALALDPLAANAVFVSPKNWFTIQVVKDDGTTVPLKSIRSLTISLQAEEVDVPPSVKELPRYTKTGGWQIDTNDEEVDHDDDDDDDDDDDGSMHD